MKSDIEADRVSGGCVVPRVGVVRSLSLEAPVLVSSSNLLPRCEKTMDNGDKGKGSR